jgi:hypothetical protein
MYFPLGRRHCGGGAGNSRAKRFSTSREINMKNRTSAVVKTIYRALLCNSSLGVALAICVFALSLIAVSAKDGSDVVSKIEASLAGSAINGLIPRGEAEAKTFADGNRKFEVHVTNVNLPDNTVLNIFVDGANVGTLRLVGLTGELELETKDGQTVPQINSRTRVVVSNQAGNTIVAGSFSNIPPPTPTPTPGASPSPTPSPSPNPNGETRLESRLAGAPIGGLLPKGHAKFRARANGRRQLNVEVEKVNLPAGTVLNVLIDNVNVGQIVLNSTLENELELESEHGAIVPSITSASTVVVTDAQGKPILSGTFNTAATPIAGNDIDDSHYFVEQHYRDFFDREADDSGLDFWEHQITNCGDDSGCRERARVNTSGAFFLSIEFQETGYLLYRFNKASFGTMPRRNDFIVEMQLIAQGVVVGQTGWQQKLEDNKRQAAERWASRADFHSRFDSKSNSQFVDELFANAGVTPGQQERQDLINGLNAAVETRGSVLRKVAENAELTRKEKNPAFVLMQYFGYLHRNPDEGPDHDFSGFNFWLHKLDDNGGDFHRAEMVKAFLVAGEYRDRFNW